MLRRFDSFDGLCFMNGLVFYAPVALLIRTGAGVSNATFFMLQALLSAVILLGEIPTGLLTDKIGYKRSLIAAQAAMLAARVLMLAAFLTRSMGLFIAEAVAEGIGSCFASGTQEAYLYSVYGEEILVRKSARSANYGTAGFLLSTLAYVLLYRFSGMTGLLLATVLSGIGGLAFSLILAREKTISAPPEKTGLRRVFSFFRKPEAFRCLGMLSVFSLIWILINFFYVERLQAAGIAEEWMSALIIAYSLIQMLAEPLLARLEHHAHAFPAVCAAAGVLVLLLGFVQQVWCCIALMCVLPLAVSLPEFLLSEKENRLIDEMGLQQNRAASLSAMNMGVNVMEIGALCLSSLFSLSAARWCFAAAGGLLLLFSLQALKQKSAL